MKRFIFSIGIFGFCALFFGLLYREYIQRVAAFGCFDDCFNYGAGYFLTQGKLLYRDIFFNHQPLMAYISAAVQRLTNPINIYELLLRHRQFLFLFGFVFQLLIIYRFRFPGFVFMLLYEPTKWYLFGDRFLAEGFIIYPLVYVFGLVSERIAKKVIKTYEVFLAGLFTWFICFAREPYIPLALFLFGFLMWKTKHRLAFFLFLFLVCITVAILPIRDYFYNVVTITQQTVVTDSLNQLPLFERISRMVLYPLQIVLTRHDHIAWQGIHMVMAAFLLGLINLVRQKKYTLVIISLLTLLLANIRAVEIGTVFYTGFQLLPWYALLLFMTPLYIRKIKSRNIQLGMFLFLFIASTYVLLSPQSWLREKTSPHEEFITNYSTEIQIGNVIKELSAPTDTLFLDGWAELIHWQANRPSPYKYSWYTSVMPQIPLYAEARKDMFLTRPPDFYYGSCPNEQNPPRIMPDFVKGLYTNILSMGTPSCLWIKTEKLSTISEKQWIKANELLFDRPTLNFFVE